MDETGRVRFKLDRLAPLNGFVSHRDRCREAGVPGSIHGLRKAGATRLADAGASDWEIASYLAHTDTTQASIYTREANRSKLADSGFEKLGNLSNAPEGLDGEED